MEVKCRSKPLATHVLDSSGYETENYACMRSLAMGTVLAQAEPNR